MLQTKTDRVICLNEALVATYMSLNGWVYNSMTTNSVP